MTVLIDRHRRTIVLRRLLPCAVIVLMTACTSGHGGRSTSPSAPPEPAAIPDALTKSPWLAEDIGGGGVIDNAQTTLTITAEGRAEGSGGCNRFSGPVSIDGDAMTFGHIASTRKACVPALLDQEQKFLIALAGTRSYTLDASALTLLDASGRPVVRLTRM